MIHQRRARLLAGLLLYSYLRNSTPPWPVDQIDWSRMMFMGESVSLLTTAATFPGHDEALPHPVAHKLWQRDLIERLRGTGLVVGGP